MSPGVIEKESQSQVIDGVPSPVVPEHGNHDQPASSVSVPAEADGQGETAAMSLETSGQGNQNQLASRVADPEEAEREAETAAMGPEMPALETHDHPASRVVGPEEPASQAETAAIILEVAGPGYENPASQVEAAAASHIPEQGSHDQPANTAAGPVEPESQAGTAALTLKVTEQGNDDQPASTEVGHREAESQGCSQAETAATSPEVPGQRKLAKCVPDDVGQEWERKFHRREPAE